MHLLVFASVPDRHFCNAVDQVLTARSGMLSDAGSLLMAVGRFFVFGAWAVRRKRALDTTLAIRISTSVGFVGMSSDASVMPPCVRSVARDQVGQVIPSSPVG